jgi:hypothetical protein
MKINRKFLKRVQRETSPRKSIQHIRKCYLEGGILQTNNDITETIYSKKQFKQYLKKWWLGPIINTEMCLTNSSSSLSFEELRKQFIANSCYPMTLNEVYEQFSIDTCVIPKSPTLGLTFTYRMPNISTFVYGVTT